MDAGCICCSLVGDFGRALNQVIEQYEPDRILIEPSGVGKLSDVIIAVQDLQNDRIQLNGFTTVVDAKKCKMYMKNFGEFFNNQIEHASSIILSHTDGIAQEKLDKCVALLREHNQQASIVTTPWDQLTGAQILEIMEQKKTLSAELDHLREEAYAEEAAHAAEHEHEHHHDHGHHHADEVFEDFGCETAHKYTKEQITAALTGLSDIAEVGQVLRAKGIVENLDGGWIHFDYVPGEPEVREGAAATTGMICVIGAGIDKERIQELFDLA